MQHARTLFVICLALWSFPSTALAGWVIQSRNTAIKSNGERQTPEMTTMRVSQGKVRLEQPKTVTLMDYNSGRFTLMNPERSFFWTGTVEQYVAEMVSNRKARAEQRLGANAAASFGKSTVDEKTLPTIVVRTVGPSDAIAGHPATKYYIESNGEQFQEMWFANNFNISADLDPKKYLEYQQKLSSAMLGKSAESLNAMYRNPEVRSLYDKGFVLQSITRHLGGGFERSVTGMQQAEIAPSAFEVPESYRRVRLADLFPSSQEEG